MRIVHIFPSKFFNEWSSLRKIQKKKNGNVINSCYYGKKKINYCYGFMPGDIQVICGSMVNENCPSPTWTETSDCQSLF